MQVIKCGKHYKASRITGPTHNFLGLALTDATVVADVHIEQLSAGGENSSRAKLDRQMVLEKVLEGVAQANADLETDYRVERMQYVPTDTDDLRAYVELAKSITQAWAAETMANPRKSAIS